MKKLVSFLIIAMLAMSTLASCSFLSGLIGGKEDPIEYDLEGAKEYLVGYFEDESTTTPSDYEVPAQIPVGDYNYQITWTVDRQDITITVVNGMAKIDLNEKTPEEITYTLTATIADGNGETTTYTRTCTIPAYNVISFEDYMAAEKGTTVTVEGIVVAMNGKSVGNSRNHLFLADASGKGGYYCYQLDDDPVAAGVEIGMTVTVTATVEPYSGMQETKGGTFAIVSTEKQTVAVKDITDTFKNGGDLKNLVGLAVTIKGVEVKEQDLSKDTSQYLYFELNGERGYVRTYITDFPHDMSHEVENNPDKIAIDTAHAEKFGWSANVTGILILYNGAPYLIPMGTDCFEYLAPIVKTPAEKIEDVIEADISIPEKILEDTVITLPLAGKNYTDVTIAWAIDNNAYTIGADGKLSIVLADEAVTLTLTATVSCDTATPVVKTYTISVKAASKGVYIGEHVDAPVVDTAYKFYLYNAFLGKSLYFNGTISDKYLGTSENAADGVDVYLEKVMDGETVKGYRFYFMDGETKTYIDIISGGKAALVTANPTAVYNYVAETNIWSANVEGTDYYLGTYESKGKTYTTISASKASYINADNTGKTQFPAGFATLVPATYVPNNQKGDATVETAYKFYLYNAFLGKNLYFNGTISDKYLGTSENAADGVDVYLEKVMDGETVKGYRFYFMDGETKTYIDIISGGKAALVTANPTAVYNYVAETNIWSANVEGTDYYLGTYESKGKTYTTISASKASYINADNTGKTQFPAGFATLTAKKVSPVNQTAPVADTAYKFYLYNAYLGKLLYFNGTINDKYLGTSTDSYDAVDVYVEKVMDGETVKGYRFYFMDGETKTYIDIISGGKAALVTANPTAVYNYVAETNIWSANVEGTDYYLGTYESKGKTYTTISASKASYISADNTGKTQFPAGVALMEVVEDHVCEFADATCTAPKTCECGKTEGEALGHNIENKVCTRCGAKVVTVTEAAALEDGTLVFVEGTVSKITYAWSDSSKNMSVDITDGTTTLNAFKLATKVGAGDVIVIYGKVSSFNNKKQIAQGGTAEIKTAHTCTTYTEGKCPVCGANEPVANQTTATKTIAELITANNWDSNTVGQSFNLDDKVSVKVDGGLNSGKAYSGEHIRIYATDTPAGTLTITVAAGYELVSVKVSTKTGTYAFLCVDGSTTDISNVSTDVSGTSVVLNSVKNGTDGKQVRVTAIEVVYKVAE